MMIFNIIFCVCCFFHALFTSRAHSSLNLSDTDGEDDQLLKHHFPTHVRPVKVRLDIHTREPVGRGRFEFIDGIPSHNPHRKVPLAQFRKILQCAPNEPDLDGDRGTISLLRLAPLSRSGLEAVCAWIGNIYTTIVK